MLIGAHVPGNDPLAQAERRGADAVQFFLSPPQSYAKPKPREDAEALLAATTPIYVHAPYLINVATTANRIRHPSRSLLQTTCDAAAAIGARAVIVHGGHLPEGEDVAAGYVNWRSTLERLETDLSILIENTAGGQNAIARRFDRIAALWDVLDGVGTSFGFCLDTCHTHAAGEELATAVERIVAITGRIDLLHVNDSKDAPGSGRDRHQNLGHGTLDEDVLVDVIRSAQAPVIVETPDDGAGQAGDIAWIRSRLG